MAIISISEAARRYKMGRQTIRKRINNGELSASVMDGGAPGLEVSELIRVFGPIPGEPGTSQPLESASTTTLDQASQVAMVRLEAENAALRAQVAAQDANLADLRQAMRLIEHKQEAQPEKAKRGFWPWSK